MGADLYIECMDRKKQYTGFRTDVNVGYFRDCYNESGLFSKLGLSWWLITSKNPEWFNKEGNLTVEGSERLLSLIKVARKQTRLNKEYDKWYKQLENLLKSAIKQKSNIIWSV